MQVVIPRLAQTGLNSPTELPNLAAWYNARDTASLTIDGSDRVSMWQDRSGLSDEPGLVLPGVSGNRATAPDSAALSVTGDITITSQLSCDDWDFSGDFQGIVSKRTGAADDSYSITIVAATGTLAARFSSDGSPSNAGEVVTSTVPVPLADLQKGWIQVTRQASSGDVKMYTSTDGTTWAQLGATLSTTPGNIFNSSSILRIGERSSAGTRLRGVVYRLIIKDGYDGAGAVVFDADFTKQPKLTTSFTEDSVNAATVTVNQSGDLPARITGARDLYQGTVSKMPIYLPWAGENYGYHGIYETNQSLLPTGEYEIIVRDFISVGSFINQGTTGSSGVFELGRISTAIRFVANTDGTPSGRVNFQTFSYPFLDQLAWLRVTFQEDVAGSAICRIFGSNQATNNVNEVIWTQYGGDITGSAITLNASSQNFGVNRGGHSLAPRTNATPYYASVALTIGGTPEVVFNPADYADGSSFTSAATGEVWTLNGGATIVTKTKLYFDGSNDFLKAPPFALSQPTTVYFVGEQVTWTSGRYLMDGGAAANSGALVQTTATPQLNLHAGTSAAGNTGAAVSTRVVIAAVFNGASSSLRVNLGAATTGSAGTTAANGLTVGANGAAIPANFGNVAVSDIVKFAAIHDTATQDRIIRALARQGSISV